MVYSLLKICNSVLNNSVFTAAGLVFFNTPTLQIYRQYQAKSRTDNGK